MRARRESTRAGAPDGRSGHRLPALRQTLSAALVSLLLAGVLTFSLWDAATEFIRGNYHRYLITLAQTAARFVDPQLHSAVLRAGRRSGPDYARAVEPLRRIRTAVSDIEYIYTAVRDGGGVRFVLDSADPGGRLREGIDDQGTLSEVHEAGDRTVRIALGDGRKAGETAVSAEPYFDQGRAVMTASAPIVDSAGRPVGAVGVDVDASAYVAQLAAARNWAMAVFALASLLVALLGLSSYHGRLRNRAQPAEPGIAISADERRRLRSIMEGTHVGTWQWDDATGLTLSDSDDRWAAMTGYRPEELGRLISGKWQSLVHPEDESRLEESIARIRAMPGATFAEEFRVKHARGHWVWIAARGEVLERHHEGRPLRTVGIYEDVSERKHAEQALKDSERRFRSLFELAPVGFSLNDLQTGRFLHVNDALLASTGYTREEFLQMHVWDITPTAYAATDITQINTLERTDQYGPYEKEYRRKDGSTYPVLISGIRMTDASGRAVIWSIAQDISRRKAKELELAEAATRDKLTGLANRALFMESLKAATDRVRSGKQPLFAVLFLDFDRFKHVNDTLGHESGDELLRQIAARLNGVLRTADTTEVQNGNLVCRFGGDEFLILINDLRSGDDAFRIAERLLNALAPAYRIFEREVHSSASMGIVTSEQCLTSAEDVLRSADVAMYEAKRAGRARAVLFNEAMHSRLTRDVSIETSLRRAI
jgi:diguanylate cyclase (GGDEF)-like protein/PAS domain S-box-containing protein